MYTINNFTEQAKADPKLAKNKPNLARPSISNCSLLYVPEDAVEGFEARIRSCVNWSTRGAVLKYHLEKCSRTQDLPLVSFSEALKMALHKSLLHDFLDENSTLTFQQHWEITVPAKIWDNERFGTEEAKICFRTHNNVVDNLLKFIEHVAKQNNRDFIWQELKKALVLRVVDCNMTHLDDHLKDFVNLTTLSCCGNNLDKIDCNYLPTHLRVLELQANRISNLDTLTNLPRFLLYLGLGRNLLNQESFVSEIFINKLPRTITVLDFSDNDIYELGELVNLLATLPNLHSLLLHGNPCSVCTGYAVTVIARLDRLRWLDNRQVLPHDRPKPTDSFFYPHLDDQRSGYFNFWIIRIMSVPVPPKTEKGQTGTFRVELKLPLLDSELRSFLMFRDCESTSEMFPLPEDYNSSIIEESTEGCEEFSVKSDIYTKLVSKNSRTIRHYTTFMSNEIPWNNYMVFQEPAVRIFCPDLRALRDTFRSTITLNVIYSLYTPAIKGKEKNTPLKVGPSEQYVVLASIKCDLRDPDWSQHSQHFFWDTTLGTDNALYWGDGDLNALQYAATVSVKSAGKTPPKPEKGSPQNSKLPFPEDFTCHFGFGIERLVP